MPTGFDLLEQSVDYRRHWIRRIGAFAIDVVLIASPISLALMNFASGDAVIIAGVFSGLGLFVYSAMLETIFGQTIGKKIMMLRVVSLDEWKVFRHAFVRSIPKLIWPVFLPIDTLAGLATKGDLRQRWSDHLTNTTVIRCSQSVFRTKAMTFRESANQSYIDGDTIIQNP